MEKTDIHKQESASLKFRKEGNNWYTHGMAPLIHPLIQKDRFLKATAAYDKARLAAKDNLEELRSATKNLGLSNWRIAQATEWGERKNKTEIIFYFSESFKYLSLAYKTGQRCGKKVDDVWLTELGENIEFVLDEASRFIDQCTEDLKMYTSMHFEFFDCIPDKRFCSQAMFAVAEKMFNQAIVYRDNNDFKDSLYWLNEARRPLEEAQQNGKHHGDSFLVDVRVKKEDVELELSIAQSAQANFVAGGILGNYTFEEEFIDMNAVYEAMDWYKKAAILARGNDLEQEAIACHYLGYIHEKVLRTNSKAKIYYKQVMSLTEAAKPRIFTSKTWYQDSVKSLRRYQEEAVRRDDAEQQKRKQKYLDMLQKEIKSIEEANKNEYELMKFLCETFPPKLVERRRKFKVGKDLDALKSLVDKRENTESYDEKYEIKKDMKKILLKAVTDYHPDKVTDDLSSGDGNREDVDREEETKKWKVFAEKITQFIMKYYENAKG